MNYEMLTYASLLWKYVPSSNIDTLMWVSGNSLEILVLIKCSITRLSLVLSGKAHELVSIFPRSCLTISAQSARDSAVGLYRYEYVRDPPTQPRLLVFPDGRTVHILMHSVSGFSWWLESNDTLFVYSKFVCKGSYLRCRKAGRR